MGVDPTADDIKRLMAEDDGGPLFMLNLLAFDGEDGRALYGEYAGHADGFVRKVGGEVLYFGAAAGPPLVQGDGRAWDATLVVRYPSRAAFLEMVMDPEYQKITHLRTQALVDAVLQPTAPWAG